MPTDWTFADLNADVWTFTDLAPSSSDSLDCGPKTSGMFGTVDYHRIRDGYESGLAGMFAGEAGTGCPFRRQVLYWRDRERGLLPSDLSRADRKGEKRPLLSERRGSSGGRLSPLSALPAREFSWNAGMVGNFQHSFASSTADR